MKASAANLLKFSGRASRSDYWKYAVPILVVLAGTVAFDLFILDPIAYKRETITTDLFTGEKSHEISTVIDYGPGLLSLVVSIVLLIPFSSVLVRRVHDIGFPAWHAFLALFLAFFFGPALTFFANLLGIISIPLALIVAFFLGVPQLILSLLALIVIILWGTTPSEPGPNEYGPNPLEAKP
jgi:uncharacterized membrane protein YhaH (DUF805 family)